MHNATFALQLLAFAVTTPSARNEKLAPGCRFSSVTDAKSAQSRAIHGRAQERVDIRDYSSTLPLCYDFPVKHEAKGGRFITFEGLDGCGKSTHQQKLADFLREKGMDVLTTREPGGTEMGERVRGILLDSRTRGLTPLAELALMFASRAQQISEIILPALNRGTWVLCDRYTDSSEAYQGAGRQLGAESVLTLHRVLCLGLQPDLTLLLDNDVAASVARAQRRNLAADGEGDENRFEMESRAFFERVHLQFQAIARREPERVVTVDARRPKDVVHHEIVAAVRERLLARQG
jgi:dTMP kinase